MRASWKTLLDAAGESAHPGALLYLTKYFTPRPPGEPHFFVKPSALMRTPAVTSMLIEGTSGAGFEVMRGVVESDFFHATPAVFHRLEAGRTIEVAEGTPLVELFPVPRALVDAGLRCVGSAPQRSKCANEAHACGGDTKRAARARLAGACRRSRRARGARSMVARPSRVRRRHARLSPAAGVDAHAVLQPNVHAATRARARARAVERFDIGRNGRNELAPVSDFTARQW